VTGEKSGQAGWRDSSETRSQDLARHNSPVPLARSRVSNANEESGGEGRLETVPNRVK
jgi:hypothetical protein